MALRVSLLLLFFTAFVARGDEETLSVTRVDENSFYVAGYSIRTNNADETSGRGKIGRLWQTFVQENLAATIPDRIDHDLIVVYSDYAGDENGDYTYMLGARVSSIDHLRAGITFRRVIAAPYAVLTTRAGPLVEVLQAEWKKIWTATAAELGGRRAFATDHEIYDQRSPAQRSVQLGARKANSYQSAYRFVSSRSLVQFTQIKVLWAGQNRQPAVLRPMNFIKAGSHDKTVGRWWVNGSQ